MEDLEYQKKLADRYQFQPWYIKLWRRRWYLLVPFWTIKLWGSWWMGYNEETEEWDIPEERTTLWLAYSLARGRATHKMNWFFTMDECTDLLWDEDEDSV